MSVLIWQDVLPAPACCPYSGQHCPNGQLSTAERVSADVSGPHCRLPRAAPGQAGLSWQSRSFPDLATSVSEHGVSGRVPAAAALCLPPPWEPGTISPPPALCAECLWNAARWARPRRQDTAESGDHYKNLLVSDAILSLSLSLAVGAVAALGVGGKLSRSPPGRQRRRHRRKQRAERGGGEGGGEGTRKERRTGPGSPGRQQQPEPGETLRSRLPATVSES